ncbi:hypothetical protein K3G63_16385 [Hymenobacter sp. HSC-4F20]|uniref:hypothetical protein n=1 Tax=Hymenobacter sp. HSC-4F20 TaxID=2864135 RepID=UPI001C73797F|nr:hypothetical protein [Hymenobacter sp. HSC-4F20]MBX0292029.1 hypothetical protein [Hymenobacter sp. HSC-4F20]
MNKLSHEEYQAVFQAPMLDVTTTAEPVLDIWPYVESVPVSDLKEYTLSDGLVPYVYQHPRKAFLHVLIATNNADVFLVIIIDLNRVEIYGHYLLDLLKLYGLTPDSED